MSGPVVEGRGSLQYAMDRLGEIEATIHPSLHVYPWWRADMSLPALWNWMTPGDAEGRKGAGDAPCDVRVWARIVVSIGIDPTAVIGGGDMLEIAAYHDLAIPRIAGAVYARNPFGQRLARMRGAQTVADRLGDIPILVLEVPVEIALDVPTVPPTP